MRHIMKIIYAYFIYTPEGFIAKQAVAFTNTIKEVGSLETLETKYPDATIIETAQTLYSTQGSLTPTCT